MQDRELYRRILGIETPWYVKSVDLKLEVGEVHVHLGHEPVADWQCPECGSRCKLYETTSRRGTGGTWILANTRQSCTLSRRGASVRIME